MTTTAHHGVHGCYCEDCLGSRIRIAVEPANPERPENRVPGRRRFGARLRSDVILRRVS